MDYIYSLIEQIKKQTFLYFVVGFIVLWLLWKAEWNSKQFSAFFIIVFLCIVGFIMQHRQQAEKAKSNNISSLIGDIQNRLKEEYEVPENKIFQIHKTPNSLKFISKNVELQKVVYDLRFMKIYDIALYEKFVSYLEYFLKIHYKIMIGKYEFDLYISTLRDVRNEILNTMKTMYFNIPNVSTILYISNIDQFVEKRIETVQAITFKYMKVIHHKYQRRHVLYEPPFEFDPSKDIHYCVY